MKWGGAVNNGEEWFNWCALALCVLTTYTVEQSFKAMETGRVSKWSLTDADTLDMVAMREQGLTFKEIGEIYNLDPSGVHRRIQRLGLNPSKGGETK